MRFPCLFPGSFFQHLGSKYVPRINFGTLKIDEMDAKIDTKVDAEKVSKNNSTIIRKCSQIGREIDEQICLFAKG